jgi:phage shock protein A
MPHADTPAVGELSPLETTLAKAVVLADKLRHELDEARREVERLRLACSKMNDEVCQTLGKALGYPWFKNDQKSFPGADESNGVCVGEHVAETLAAEAAARIAALEAENAGLRQGAKLAKIMTGNMLFNLEQPSCPLDRNAVLRGLKDVKDALGRALITTPTGGEGEEAGDAR